MRIKIRDVFINKGYFCQQEIARNTCSGKHKTITTLKHSVPLRESIQHAHESAHEPGTDALAHTVVTSSTTRVRVSNLQRLCVHLLYMYKSNTSARVYTRHMDSLVSVNAFILCFTPHADVALHRFQLEVMYSGINK